MASPWVGGTNFVMIKRGCNNGRKGGVHSGNGSNNNLALNRRGRFNANPTRVNHPSCQIAAQSKKDKEVFRTAEKPVKRYSSGLS